MSLLSDMVVAGFFEEESLCQFAEPIAEISRQDPGLPAFTPSSDGTLVYLEPGFYSDICLSSGISEMYLRFKVVGDIENDTELPGSEFFERVEVREGRGYCFMMIGAYSMDDALTATIGNWFLLPQFQKEWPVYHFCIACHGWLPLLVLLEDRAKWTAIHQNSEKFERLQKGDRSWYNSRKFIVPCSEVRTSGICPE